MLLSQKPRPPENTSPNMDELQNQRHATEKKSDTKDQKTTLYLQRQKVGWQLLGTERKGGKSG
jgi:transglutaminase/protease-like cytokinesis protein 3